MLLPPGHQSTAGLSERRRRRVQSGHGPLLLVRCPSSLSRLSHAWRERVTVGFGRETLVAADSDGDGQHRGPQRHRAQPRGGRIGHGGFTR